MINNKKGLSMIVSTLIVILLVLVAIGIIWTVVRNVVNEGTETIDISTKCLDVTVEATAVTCDGTDCAVTLERSAGGEEIDGVMLAFTDITGTSNIIWEYNTTKIAPLEIIQVTSANGVDTTLTTVNNVEVSVFFTDASGNDQLCSGSTSYAF